MVVRCLENEMMEPCSLPCWDPTSSKGCHICSQAFEESEEVEPPSPGWTVKIQVAYQRIPAGWKSVFDTLTRSNYGPGMSRTIRRPRPTIGLQLFLNACSFVSDVQVNGCLHFPNPACHGSSGPLLPQTCHVPFIRHSSCGVCGVDLPWFIFIAPGSLPLEGFNSWPPVCASKSPHISGHTASYRFVCLPMLVCLFRCWIHFRIRYCNYTVIEYIVGLSSFELQMANLYKAWIWIGVHSAYWWHFRHDFHETNTTVGGLCWRFLWHVRWSTPE